MSVDVCCEMRREAPVPKFQQISQEYVAETEIGLEQT